MTRPRDGAQSKARPRSSTGRGAVRGSVEDWRIVRYVDGDSGEVLHGVTHRGRRRAWGLKDRASAERWLERNGVPVQSQLRLEDLATG